jgi:hypothetical protein
MGVFLIILVFLGSLPAFDFRVFQDMKSCIEAKRQVEEAIKQGAIPKPLYLECKSAPAREQEASN